MDASSQEIKTLTEDNKRLRIDISSLQASNHSLTDKYKDEKQRSLELQLKLVEMEHKVEQYDRLKHDLAQLQQECQTLRGTVNKLQESVTEAELKTCQAEKVLQLKEELCLKQSALLRTLENDKANLESQLQSTAPDAEKWIHPTIVEDLREKLKAQESLIQSLHEKLGIVKQETQIIGCDSANELFGPSLPPAPVGKTPATATTTDDDDKKDLSSLETQLADLRMLLHYREELILKIYDEIKQKTQTIESLTTEKESLTSQNTAMRKELMKVVDNVNELQSKYDDLRRQHNTSSSSRSRGRSKEGGSAADSDRWRHRYEEEREKRKRLEKEADELDQKVNQLKAKLGGRVPSSSSASSSVTTSSSAKPSRFTVTPTPPVQPDINERARIVELQATIRDLRTENDAKRSELFDVRARLEEKGRQIDQLTSQLKSKEKNASEMTQRLSQVQIELDRIAKEHEELLERYDTIQHDSRARDEDILSMKTSNHYLAQCVQFLRRRLRASTGQEISLKKEVAFENAEDSNYHNVEDEPMEKKPRMH